MDQPALVVAGMATLCACSGGIRTSSEGEGGPAEDGGDTAMDVSPADAPSSAAPDVVDEQAAACVAQPVPDAGVCNSLQLSGSPLTIACAGSITPPAPSGGAIVDGTYVLTSATHYGTCGSPSTYRSTWSVCGTSWQTFQEETQAGVPGTVILDATVTVSGVSLGVRPTCGSQGPETFGYSATPSTLTIFASDPSDPSVRNVDVYARQ